MTIDWSLFNREYPVKDGIVMALPKNLAFDVAPDVEPNGWFSTHSDVLNDSMRNGKLPNFLFDKTEMAKMQKTFYDRIAFGFQGMDDVAQTKGAIGWWRVERMTRYDERHFKKGKLLFIGAGNCRRARIYAKMGYDVVATDISVNMLRIGRARAEQEGVKMTYVCHNAELPYPFKTDGFHTVFSHCVMNHIVDWKTYLLEKMRCLKSSGVLLERMPNAENWKFWKTQGALNKGVEIKAKYCTPSNAEQTLINLGLHGKVWTHYRQRKADWLHSRTLSFLRPISKFIYRLRSLYEDHITLPLGDDNTGRYTVFKIIKDCLS